MTAAGWKARLFNMGYLYDPDVDGDDAEFAFAVSDFQVDNGMDVTGKLDDTTKSKVKEVYGC